MLSFLNFTAPTLFCGQHHIYFQELDSPSLIRRKIGPVLHPGHLLHGAVITHLHFQALSFDLQLIFKFKVYQETNALYFPYKFCFRIFACQFKKSTTFFKNMCAKRDILEQISFELIHNK